MSRIVENRIGRLFGKIQNYSWGGYNFIPMLIGLRPEPDLTYAEYWMGAYEKAPSQILQNNGTPRALNDLIKEQLTKTLGPYVAQRYGRLPFLVRVMDVREMLSIQVHPTKSEAEVGFARENEMGIPLDSPERNYRDDNHKPELYKYVMEMPQESVNALLNSLVERVLQKYTSGELEESSPDYWVAKAIEGKQAGDYDRGIFSMYFFNLVKLMPGQATFQDAGVPHTYLQGQAIEIMANSDNVIRGRPYAKTCRCSRTSQTHHM